MTATNTQPDSYFVAEVRRILRDQPTWTNDSLASDGTVAAFTAASKPLRLQRQPVTRTSPFLTAPAATAGQPGFVSYTPLFDPPSPTFQPTQAPVLSDGGAGALAAGNYQVVYTYVTAAGEQGMSVPSNLFALGANRRITTSALSGLPAAVTAINDYLTQSPGVNIGFLGQRTVTANAAATATYNAGGNGVLPVLIITDTGEIFFPVAPATGSVNVQYQAARFSDTQILDGLYDGLQLLWPEIWNPSAFDTTSILPNPVGWEYNLPTVFQDQRVILLEVEANPPGAFVVYRRLSGWRVANDAVSPKLIFDKPPPVGGTVRLTYAGPFTALANVPSQAQNLPVYYALARLLADTEVMRARADDLPALTGETASQQGGNLQTSSYWMQMYLDHLRKLDLGPPARRSLAERSVEKLGLGRIWQGAA